PVIGERQRETRSKLVIDAARYFPVPPARAPAGHRAGIVADGHDDPAEVRIAVEPAFAVGSGVEQIAVGDEVPIQIVPRSSGRRRRGGSQRIERTRDVHPLALQILAYA